MSVKSCFNACLTSWARWAMLIVAAVLWLFFACRTSVPANHWGLVVADGRLIAIADPGTYWHRPSPWRRIVLVPRHDDPVDLELPGFAIQPRWVIRWQDHADPLVLGSALRRHGDRETTLAHIAARLRSTLLRGEGPWAADQDLRQRLQNECDGIGLGVAVLSVEPQP